MSNNEDSLTSTTYDMYMKNLSKVKRLTNAEQRALHVHYAAPAGIVFPGAVKAREALQGQALLIVLYIFQKMLSRNKLETVEAFDMDAIQEANLAALTALPQWDPVRGTLATWLIPHIRGALLNYANTHTSGGIGSKHNKLIQVAIDEVIASEELIEAQDAPHGLQTEEPITLQDSLTYESDVFPNAEKAWMVEQVRRQAWRVRYGIYLHRIHEDGYSIEEMARAERVSQETIRLRLRAAEIDLKNLLESSHLHSVSGF